MCALVRGMTDILTPVNELWNSSFTRTDGYPTSSSFDTITKGVNNWISGQNISIYEPSGTYGTITNVSYSISNGVLTVSGTHSSVSGQNRNTPLWIVFNQGLTKINTDYTIAYKASDEVGCTVSLAGLPVIHTNIYAKGSNDPTCTEKILVTHVGSSRSTFICAQINILKDSTSFSFKVWDFCAYEGCYCNPPVRRSIDNIVGVPFVLREDVDYLSINACLCKYMATAIDTSAALTTTGCIKDISGNVHHTQVNSSSNGTVPYISDCGKVIQSISTRTEAYAFNTKNIGIQLTNDGTYDELTSFTRFKYVNRASSLDNTNKACGLEWSLASSGGAQAARWNYWYVRDGTTKIGVCINIKNGKRESDLTTISFGHMYAVMWSVSLIKGLRTIYIYDITDNKIIFSESITIPTKDSGNQWNLNNSTYPNHRPYLFLASGASVLVMESAMYSCYMNCDNFNYLVDNYHPEVGAAYLGA